MDYEKAFQELLCQRDDVCVDRPCNSCCRMALSGTVNEAVLGIVSSAIMAFVAAGISIVYQIENIPKAFAGLIQCAVLYIDYLGIYIINGWIPTDRIWVFTLIFLAVFVIVWSSIYIPIHIRVKKINRTLREKNGFSQSI